MPISIPPRSLPADFGSRIADMRRIAIDRGHADVAYLLELASEMATQRENAAAMGLAHWRSAIVVPDEAMAGTTFAE